MADSGGARIIPPSRRPDGTLRKEIRVRAGFVPLEEVAVYEAKGSRPRNAVPSLPPGVDPQYAAQVAARKAKAAKKNEKRKEKKLQEVEKVKPSGSAISTQLENLQVSCEPSVASSSPLEIQNPGNGVLPAKTNRGKADVEKNIRALRKKIRQAESLQASIASRSSGEISEEEKLKISKLTVWQAEMTELENLLSAL